MIRISISNYRCFSRARPVHFDIGPGLTAFVGPNNSGKSSLLRFFYEMRPLLFDGQEYIPTGVGISSNLNGVEDPTEIFCNLNDGDLRFDLAFPEAPCDMSAVHFVAKRGSRNWHISPEWAKGSASPEVSDEMKRQVLALAKTLYIGPFRNVLNVGETKYYDLSIGTEFVRLWDSWKNGGVKSSSRRIRDVEEDLKRIFGFTTLSINPSEDGKTFQVFVNGEPYRLGELGAGLSQFIVVFGAAAVASPDYILIDEPELHLHPSLQVDFLLSLARYAKKGILFATHSIGLARSVADRIYSLRPTSDGTDLGPLAATLDYLEFLGEMSFAAFRELGFRRLLLVEGVTEVKVVQQFLRFYGKEHQVVAIPLGGSQMINGRVASELAELKRITDLVTVIVDSERGSESEPLAKDREEFIQTCKLLGFDARITTLRATENYFTESALRLAFGAGRRPLGPYERLRDHPVGWSKSENWRIASFMTKGELEATDLGSLFRSL